MSKPQKTKNQFNRLYHQLNSEQKEAVDIIEGPLMVLAGPGTGKTQVLAMRVANILRQTQMDPWNILCLTFTETAAVEMRQRLITVIGEAAYYVKIYTFHGFCNEVIHDNPEKFIISGGQVLSKIEKAELWRELIDQLPGQSPLRPFGRPYLYLRNIISAIQWIKKEGVDVAQFEKLIDKTEDFLQKNKDIIEPFIDLSTKERSEKTCSDFKQQVEQAQKRDPNHEALWLPVMDALREYYDKLQTADNKREAGKARTELKNKVKKYWLNSGKQIPKQRELAKLYEMYQEKLLTNSRYDFEDMILQVLKVFSQDDELLAYYQEQFQYILIDEYQDTNGAQNETVRLLGSFSDKPNIFVVGDDNQSIFRFQGASLDNLLDFYRRYLNSIKIITLQNNYRSVQMLIDATTAIIDNNKESVQKYIKQVNRTLIAQTGRDEAVLRHTEYAGEEEECFGIAKQIKQLIDQGANPNQIALLYRTNKEAFKLLTALSSMGVDYQLQARENALADKRVWQLITLMQYVGSEQIDIATDKADEDLTKILHFDFWGLKPVDVAKVIYSSSKSKTSLYRHISSQAKLDAAEVEEKEVFLELSKKLAQWRIFAQNNTLPQTFDTILRESGLLYQIVEKQKDIYALNNINAVFKEIKTPGMEKDALSMEQFVTRLNIMREEGIDLQVSPLNFEDNAVTLMTAHSAKGLEFDHVFISGLVDRNWGNNKRREMLPLPKGIVRFDPVNNSENNEDERRLFYVAMTRARVGIHLSHSKTAENGREKIPSLFLLELPPKTTSRLTDKSNREDTFQRLQNINGPLLARDDKLLKNWLRERLKTYVMSVTHLNHYLECPLLFYYRNLLRAPSAKNKHMALGTAVHEALRNFHDSINNNGKVPPEEKLLTLFTEHLEQEYLSPEDKTQTISRGREILRDYYRHYHHQFGQRKTIHEYSFKSHNIQISNGASIVPITGKLDKIEFINDQEIKVTDYKTGSPDKAYSYSKPGGKYHRQLVYYRLLCDLSPRFNYKMVAGEIDFIQPSENKKKHIKHEYEISREETEELKQEILRVWEEINQLKFLNNPDAACGQCEYCQLQNI